MHPLTGLAHPVLSLPGQNGRLPLGHADLTREARAVPLAREHIRTWLGRDHPAVEDACSVTSELVANAVRHSDPRTAGPIRLFLSREPTLLYIQVTDPGNPTRMPYLRHHIRTDEESGRGLTLVHAISQGRWGVQDLDTGQRTVWCALETGEPAEE